MLCREMQHIMQTLQKIVDNYISQIYIPTIGWTDIVEMAILAFVFYHIILWIKNTRAYALVKGLMVIVFVVIIAALFNMTTILWIVQNLLSTAVIALVVVLQPELRNAMEELGQRNFLSVLFREGRHGSEGRFSDNTITEIVRACTSMSKVKTGALIVIRQETPLQEYERTGIEVDAVVTSQLLINIFEKNTPLHDGAVIIAGDRVVSATCYLPLSANDLDKELGTRHRAGVGISEVTDSMTIIVSEETGQISIAYRGALDHGVTSDELRARLIQLQDKKNSAGRSVLSGRKEKDSE